SQQTHNALHFLFVPRQYGGNPPMTVTAFVSAIDFTHGGFWRPLGGGFFGMGMKTAFWEARAMQPEFLRGVLPPRFYGFAAFAGFFF
ncbi:hypothetical protein BWD09_13700, partial [Neisseria dentiae]